MTDRRFSAPCTSGGRAARWPPGAHPPDHPDQGTQAKIFYHSCGAIDEFIPDLIEIGVEIINPVQVSARGMDSASLKQKYGHNLSFWGGGCDTQHVLSRGSPQDVTQEVRRRIADLAPGGGFVFNPVHNIQPLVPVENIAAMFEAARLAGRYPLG